MDFFAQQRAARRRTVLFVLIFVALIILVEWVAINIGMYFYDALPFAYDGQKALQPQAEAAARGKAMLVIGIAFLLIIFSGTVLRSYQLKRGGSAVAENLGGIPLPIFADDPEKAALARRLRNVVEEMAVASGTPPPKLYWLPKETAINAFVAGYTPADAVLTVTRGLLEQLNRDELQGVIAHEFSHLLNGDMRLNTRVTSWIFGLYSLFALGRSILYVSLGDFGNGWRVDPRLAPVSWIPGGAAFLAIFIAIILMIIGSSGWLCGRILQAAISRQREYLADASAVQFTRQKRGLAGALKKVWFSTSKLTTPAADSYNHFFLCAGISFELLASHPPLLERIQRLDITFNPSYSERQRAKQPTSQNHVEVENPIAKLAGLVTVNQPLELLQQELTASKFSMFDDVVFLFGQLIDVNDQTAAAQCRALIIAHGWGKTLAEKALVVAHEFEQMPVYQRLSRTRLMLVHLHELSGAQRRRLQTSLKELIAVDQKVSLLEAAVVLMVRQYLESMEQPNKTKVAGHLPWTSCTAEIALLKQFVEQNPQHPKAIALDHIGDGKTADNARQLGQALRQLDRLSMDDKRRLLQTLVENLPVYLSPDQEEVMAVIAVCLHTPPLNEMIATIGNRFQLEPLPTGEGAGK